VAKEAYDRLELWTFQRNKRARRSYETCGFVQVGESDGSRNEKKDGLYRLPGENRFRFP
jgi:RimJ/RimL family protein N-acetyltransferase